jgi:hypothetical protein
MKNRKEMHHKRTRETRDREHGKELLALCNKEENHRSPRYIEQEREEKEPQHPMLNQIITHHLKLP